MEKEIVVEAKYELKVLSQVDAVVAEVGKRFDGKKYDFTTTKDTATDENGVVVYGFNTARKDCTELVSLRGRIEIARKEEKADVLVRGRFIDSEAERMKDSVRKYEEPLQAGLDAQKAAEDAIKAEKARIAAEAQKVIDDMIIEIGKLPSRFIKMDSEEITMNLAVLEAKAFGAEFANGNLTRAEATKAEAVEEIRKILQDRIEQEAEAVRRFAEQVEAARLQEIENKRMADEREELRIAQTAFESQLAEQERLREIEEAARKAIADKEAAKLAAERAAFEAEQAEARRVAEEAARIEREKQAEIDRQMAAIQAENQRIVDEEWAKLREIERQAAIVGEAARQKAETERKAAEKALKLSAAKCKSATDAFQKILDICNDHNLSGEEVRSQVAILAEGNLI